MLMSQHYCKLYCLKCQHSCESEIYQSLFETIIIVVLTHALKFETHCRLLRKYSEMQRKSIVVMRIRFGDSVLYELVIVE